jgi:hypothetical protein
MTKRRFLYSPIGDEITTHGYRVLIFAKCITIMIVELVVTSSLGFSID